MLSSLQEGDFDAPPAMPFPNESNHDGNATLSSRRPFNVNNEPLHQDMERRVRALHRIRRRRAQRARAAHEFGPGGSSQYHHNHATPSESDHLDRNSGQAESSAITGRTAQGPSLTARRSSMEQISEDLRRAERSLQRMRQQAQEISRRTPIRAQRIEEAGIRQRMSTANDEATQEYFGEAEVNRQRAKRRKLDGDTLSNRFKGFSYGYHGQAVAGPLKMEIVSCDGGLHSNARRPVKEYWPENILRNDKTVYCTSVNKCSIILRHQGETPFSLKKIIIKAPERGFTAPIQEGLIFIAMDCKELLKQTSAYQVRESSPSISSDLDSDDDAILYERRGTQINRVEALTTTGDRPPSRRADRGTPRIVPPPITGISRLESAVQHRIDIPTTANANIPVIGAPSPPPFDVTTHCDTPSSDEEEETNETTLADRHLRNLLTPGSSDSEDLSRQTSRRIGIRQRSRRRSLPSRIEIVGPSHKEGEESLSTRSENRNGDVIAPHARFFIEPERSMVTVRFNPEV